MHRIAAFRIAGHSLYWYAAHAIAHTIRFGSRFVWDRRAREEAVRVERIDIGLPHLPPAFDGYRIVHLSDIHFGPAIAYHTVLRAFNITRDIAPDVILMTGDFISDWLDEANLRRVLPMLHAPDGVYTVLGNHDHWADAGGVRGLLQQVGIIELCNRHIKLSRDTEVIYLAGVDDIWMEEHDLAAALEGIPDGASTILLAHEPDYADQVAATGRVHLQLSGHSHGGQIRIPFGNLPRLSHFVYLARKYPHGLYQVGKMWLHTSAGLGRGHLPRLFVPPEVTEITLRCG